MRKLFVLFAIVMCTLWLASPAKAAGTELVTNGGFETGAYAPWVQGGDFTFDFLDPTRAHSGTYAADFGAIGDTSSLSQSLTASNAGEGLVVTFWLAEDFGNPDAASGSNNTFLVTLNGSTLLSLNNPTTNIGNYVEYTFSLNAPSAALSLVFSGENDGDFWSLDDVSVQAPEPQSLILLTPALLGLALLRRRA
jgi:hypothetical protein